MAKPAGSRRGARGSLRRVSVVPIARRIEALEPLKALYAEISACACRKLDSDILMMKSAQDWATKNVPGAIDGARDRCILLQG